MAKGQSKGRERSGVTSRQETLTVKINGQEILIDGRTITLTERQVMKRALAKLGYEPDDIDVLSATIWVVMRRTDHDLTFEEVCDSLDVHDLDEMDASVGESEPSPEA